MAGLNPMQVWFIQEYFINLGYAVSIYGRDGIVVLELFPMDDDLPVAPIRGRIREIEEFLSEKLGRTIRIKLID